MKSLFKTVILFVCLLSLVVLLNYNLTQAATFQDATGTNVEIDFVPKRVICLSPHLTEIVCYLGAQDKLVGRTNYCNYPQEVLALPTVGGFNDFSAEKIMKLNPDLILASRGNPLEKIDQLRKLNLIVYACDDENSLNDIYKTMSTLCSILWLPKHTVFKVKELKAQIDAISKKPTSTALKCLYVSPETTLWTCNKDTFISEIIERSGMINVARELTTRWPLINAEQVMIWQPEVLLVPVAGGFSPEKYKELKSTIQKHAILKRTPAAKSGRIILVDTDRIMRPSPGLLEALKSIIGQLKAFK